MFVKKENQWLFGRLHQFLIITVLSLSWMKSLWLLMVFVKNSSVPRYLQRKHSDICWLQGWKPTLLFMTQRTHGSRNALTFPFIHGSLTFSFSAAAVGEHDNVYRRLWQRMTKCLRTAAFVCRDICVFKSFCLIYVQNFWTEMQPEIVDFLN